MVPPSEGVTILDMPGRERARFSVRAIVWWCARIGRATLSSACAAAPRTVRLTPLSALSLSCWPMRASLRRSNWRARLLPPLLQFPRLSPCTRPPRCRSSLTSPIAATRRLRRTSGPAGRIAPAAVEGLEIVAGSGAAALELQALVGSRPPRWSEWVGAGQFVGTRGHGLPLVGLRLRLKPEAVGAEIAAEALFLGSLVASQRGRQLEFVSGSGVDPLVGVKISVQNVQEMRAGRTAAAPDAQARDREPRVRVFRASTAR